MSHMHMCTVLKTTVTVILKYLTIGGIQHKAGGGVIIFSTHIHIVDDISYNQAPHRVFTS